MSENQTETVLSKTTGTAKTIFVVLASLALVVSIAYGSLQAKARFDAFVEQEVQTRLSSLLTVNKNYAVMTAIWTSQNAKAPILKTMSMELSKCQELRETNTKANTDANGNSLTTVSCDSVETLFGATAAQ